MYNNYIPLRPTQVGYLLVGAKGAVRRLVARPCRLSGEDRK